MSVGGIKAYNDILGLLSAVSIQHIISIFSECHKEYYEI